MTDRPVWIFGAGDLARLARGYFEHDLGRKVAGFVVDDVYCESVAKHTSGVRAWSEYVAAVDKGSAELFPAVGYRSMLERARVFDKLVASEHVICNLICGGSKICHSAVLGMGVFVMPGVVVEPGVTVGNNNVLWSNSTICHDSRIGDHNFFAANSVIGGFSRVGSRSFFGFSSVLAQQLDVCDDVLVGATAFVNGNIELPGKYLGSPATLRSPINPAIGVAVAP
jgi:sugar O-acyltransferase (sialic acid O-acetyltransferase NeuD family)